MKKPAQSDFRLLGGIGDRCPLMPAFVLVTALCFFISALNPSPASAQCQTCSCMAQQHAKLRAHIDDEHTETKKHIADEFEKFRDNFFLKFFFAENLLAAMRGMNEQMVSNGLLQVLAVGSFLDATHQIETQTMMQEMAAKAHKDYHPDVEMCAIGGATRSLATAYYNSNLTSTVLARRERDRQLNHGKTLAAGQRFIDKDSRVLHLRKTYCNGSDHNVEMKHICNIDPDAETDNHETEDRDIDYRSTVGIPATINADFTNQDIAADEEDERHIFALSANLYGNDAPNIRSLDVFADPDNHWAYLQLRSIAAKRSVATHSFNTIVGLKARGSETSEEIAPFAAKFYEQMGIPPEDVQKLIGARPSYNAQMDTLTRAIYQRPDFYVNLYTTPANVDRIGASVRAINLMQNFDRFNSGLRSEMALSVILELELQKVQTSLQGLISTLPDGDIQRTPDAASGGGGP